jgi:hypothetical protein
VTGDPAPDAGWAIQLPPADAIVLYDWLMSTDLGQIPAPHRACKQALADLLTALETQVPVEGLTRAQIEQAQHELATDMGWWKHQDD